eukprot:gene8612-1541_t
MDTGGGGASGRLERGVDEQGVEERGAKERGVVLVGTEVRIGVLERGLCAGIPRAPGEELDLPEDGSGGACAGRGAAAAAGALDLPTGVLDRGARREEELPVLGPGREDTGVDDRGVEERGVELRGVELRGVDARGVCRGVDVCVSWTLTGGGDVWEMFVSGFQSGLEVFFPIFNVYVEVGGAKQGRYAGRNPDLVGGELEC